MNTGISTLVDLDLPIGELLALVRDAGFSHVSLSHDVRHARYHLPEGRRELAIMLAGNGLKLNYIHPPIEAYFDLCSLDENVRRSSIEALNVQINSCAELGGQALTVHACNELVIPLEQMDSRVSVGLESMAELSRRCEGSGVRICVENQPNPYASQTITLRLLQAGILEGQAGFENIWVTLDPNHALMENPQAVELMRELGPRVRALHLSDNLGTHDSHLIPFEGQVQWEETCKILAMGGLLNPGPSPWASQGAHTPVVDLESSLWMLRRRALAGKAHPGDPPAEEVARISTSDYLKRCHAAALRLCSMIEAAAQE